MAGLRLPEFDAPFADPGANDAFDRSSLAASVAEIVAGQAGKSAVVVVSGRPGSGRTAFLAMCHQHLARRADPACHDGPGGLRLPVLSFDGSQMVSTEFGMLRALLKAAGTPEASERPDADEVRKVLSGYSAVLVDGLDRALSRHAIDLVRAMRAFGDGPGPVFVVALHESAMESIVEGESMYWAYGNGDSLPGFVDAVVYIPPPPASGWTHAVESAVSDHGAVGQEVAQAISAIAAPVIRAVQTPVTVVMSSVVRLAACIGMRPSLVPSPDSPQVRAMWIRAAWVGTLLMWRSSTDSDFERTDPKDGLREMLKGALGAHWGPSSSDVTGHAVLIRTLLGRKCWLPSQLPNLLKDLSVPSGIVTDLSTALEGPADQAAVSLEENQAASAWLISRGVLGDPEVD